MAIVAITVLHVPVALQIVLFEPHLEDVLRLVGALGAAATQVGDSDSIRISMGDCSAAPLSAGSQRAVQSVASRVGLGCSYSFFAANLGHGVGHNRLLGTHDCNVIVTVNPDSYPAPTSLKRLLDALTGHRVGAAEARQLPVENPKYVHSDDCAVAWATGFNLAIRREAFEEVGGFDPAFFLHGDDVDLGVRLRRCGWNIRYLPNAVAFHERELEFTGYAKSNPVEAHYIRLGELVHAAKFGQTMAIDERRSAAARGDQLLRAAVNEFDEMLGDGRIEVRRGESVDPGAMLEYGLRRF